MQKKSLKIITTSNESPQSKRYQSSGKEEAQAKLERLWHLKPEQFNPLRNSIERERINRTWNLIITSISLANINAVDLGCGTGLLAERMSGHGAQVDAVDIATQPLKKLQVTHPANLKIIHDYVPRTKLSDNFYKLVLSTDVIAYLPRDLHRLYFSELSRLLKNDGFVICSTPLDINSEDALERFSTLATTEFTVERWVLSHHALFLRIKNFLETPERFSQAGSDAEYRRKQLGRRRSLNKFLFSVNSSPLIAKFWSGVAFIIKPLVNVYNQQPVILLSLEKICRFIWNERGVSHAMFLGIRRPVVVTTEPAPHEYERKHKKQVWE